MKKPDMSLIREAVLQTVDESSKKLTPGELTRILLLKTSAPTAAVHTVIKNLVNEQELVYTYHYGRSFLEKSFNKPVRISERVVLVPPNIDYVGKANQVVVKIQPGAAFGTGEHPTTRLAVCGIEQALSGCNFFQNKKEIKALDIGTGSGILAIIAALLGPARVTGLDIDACARAEARQNVLLNSLENRIAIHSQNVENMPSKFALITANLRYPTLKRLGSHFGDIAETESALVVSGLKTDEVSDLLSSYRESQFKCTWQKFEKDWAALVFVRQ